MKIKVFRNEAGYADSTHSETINGHPCELVQYWVNMLVAETPPAEYHNGIEYAIMV